MAAQVPSITASLVSGKNTFRSKVTGLAVTIAAQDTYILRINHGLPTTPDEVRPVLRSIVNAPSLPSRWGLATANASIVELAYHQGVQTATSVAASNEQWDFICEVTPTLVS